MSLTTKLLLYSILAFFTILLPTEGLAKENKDHEIKFTRLESDNPLEMNVKLAEEHWDKNSVVIIVRVDDFADALAGVPLAYSYQAPIFLTSSDELPELLKEELFRLEAEKAIILGGEGAITYQVEKELSDLGLKTQRIGGNNRFETAKEISNHLTPSSGAVIVNGENFPDALSIGTYAAKNGLPILLTRADYMPESTKKALENVEYTYIIGGKLAVSDEIKKTLPSPIRIYGNDRYQTSMKLLQELELNCDQIYLCSGTQHQGALIASTIATQNLNPVLLGREDLVHRMEDSEVIDHFIEYGIADKLEHLTVLSLELEENEKDSTKDNDQASQDSKDPVQAEEEEEETPEPTFTQKGIASYYGKGDGFHGNMTASGEIFDTYEYTAAHRQLDFGTKVEVEYKATGKTVTVRINDRGPHIDSRIIDLSWAAADAIGMGGLGEVKLRVY